MSKFVFLTPAFNCREEIRQTLFSFFAQSYDNWRAIIIDDVSDDGTGEYVEDLSKKYDFGDRITVVRREEKFGEVRNTVSEMANIEDDEIVCRVDGGDWVTENDCLNMLNQIYDKHNPSVLWTQHRWAYTDHNISGAMDLQKYGDVYSHPWVSSHMKTFRAKNLKHVPEANFFDDEGNWIMIACDQAVFLPMMHMSVVSEEPIVFLPRVCYHYSIDLEKPDLFSNERSLKQKASGEWLRKRGFVK